MKCGPVSVWVCVKCGPVCVGGGAGDVCECVSAREL